MRLQTWSGGGDRPGAPRVSGVRALHSARPPGKLKHRLKRVDFSLAPLLLDEWRAVSPTPPPVICQANDINIRQSSFLAEPGLPGEVSYVICHVICHIH